MICVRSFITTTEVTALAHFPISGTYVQNERDAK